MLGDEDGIPKNYHVFNEDAATFFFHSIDHQPSTIGTILHQLYQKNIISVLVEGGANVLQQFIDSNLWNEAHILSSDKNLIQHSTFSIQHSIKAPIITGSLTQSFQLENNFIQLFKNTHDLSFT